MLNTAPTISGGTATGVWMEQYSFMREEISLCVTCSDNKVIHTFNILNAKSVWKMLIYIQI